MLALAAVSDEIAKYPMVKDRLQKYAGPQCFAHLDKTGSDYRVRANEQSAENAGSAAEQRLEQGAVLSSACWMRCGDCGRWRLVHQNCLRVFRPECYFREEKTDRDWAWWLQQAPSRYERFLRERAGTVGGANAEHLEEYMDGVKAWEQFFGEGGVGEMSQDFDSSVVA